MRINVYSQELTDEVLLLEKQSNTGIVYRAAQLVLHSSPLLHHPPADDDRSAVTFWLPRSADRREAMAKAFERIAAIFRAEPQWEAESLAGMPAPQPAPTKQESMLFSLGEAKQLVAFFGGNNAEVVVEEWPQRTIDGEESPAGKYAYCADCPEEGAMWLGVQDFDTEE